MFAEGGRFNSPTMGANVVYLFPNDVNHEQGNTIINY
jgi:hypothetical protein